MPGTSSGRMTLQDVARAVGLSVNTVSRALNDMSGVSDATRERIKAEAQRIGYVPNIHARSLVLGARKAVGLVITNVSNPFYAELISEIEFGVSAAGYTVVLFVSDESETREQEAANAALMTGLDGLIVVPVQAGRNPWDQFHRAGIPVVQVNRPLEGFDADLVSTDNEMGAYAATQHVIDQGARTVVLIEEDLPISTIDNRISGFRRAIGDSGLELSRNSVAFVPTRRSARIALPWQADDAYRVSSDLLDRGHLADAFVVGNDYFALGLYRALGERGIRVPDDTMVVGFGDYPFSAYMDPALSTVRLPARGVGGFAVERLLGRLSGAIATDAEVITRFIEPELVVRASTRRAVDRKERPWAIARP